MPLPFLTEDLDSVLAHCGDRATWDNQYVYGLFDRGERPQPDETGAMVMVIATTFVYRAGTLEGIQIGSTITILDSRTNIERDYRVRNVEREEAGKSQTLVLAEV